MLCGQSSGDTPLWNEGDGRGGALGWNGFLRDAAQIWAFYSLSSCPWAREYYDVHRAKGTSHHGALRALGNRWLEVLWHCLTNNVKYDDAIHVANRERALGRALRSASACRR
jgi:hypothetical protein